jgi:branched-subunit amino acid transport protein
MDRQLTIWLVIFAVGAITYASRLSFIALFSRREMPPLLARALRHVPVAMVTAIVVPAIVFASPGVLAIDPGNAKLVAALVAGSVAWWCQSGTARVGWSIRGNGAVLTIAVGMIVLWSLRYFVG